MLASLYIYPLKYTVVLTSLHNIMFPQSEQPEKEFRFPSVNGLK